MGLSLTDSNSKIIPGHGELSNRAGLQRYCNILIGVRDTEQGLIDQGVTRDQVVAAGPTQQWDFEPGSGFVEPAAMAGFVYDSLVQ